MKLQLPQALKTPNYRLLFCQNDNKKHIPTRRKAFPDENRFPRTVRYREQFNCDNSHGRLKLYVRENVYSSTGRSGKGRRAEKVSRVSWRSWRAPAFSAIMRMFARY